MWNRLPRWAWLISLAWAATGCAPVDINVAREDELARLPEVDRALASAIVDYRRFHGPFHEVADLANVPAMARRFDAARKSVVITTCAEGEPCAAGASCVAGVCARSDDGLVAYTSVAGDHWSFSRAGEGWVPVGANYDRVEARVSLASYATQLSDVEGDFAEMEDLGFNAVRLSVHFHEIVSAPNQANEDMLRVLDEVLLFARRYHLQVDLTGLAFYDRAAVPAWIPALSDADFREQEKFFWRTVAARYAHDPTIFALDLQNEPSVSESNETDIVGPEFGDTGFHYGQFAVRQLQGPWQAWVLNKYQCPNQLQAAWQSAYPANATESCGNILLPGDAGGALFLPGGLQRRRDGIDFRNELAAAWAADLKGAIREVDPNHLVTVAVGWPFGTYYFYVGPTHLRDVVDFMSVHIYPSASATGESNVDELELGIRAAAVGKPVVIEEMTSYLPQAETSTFLTRTLGSASGWFAFYDGRSAGELRASPPPGGAQGAWLERFTTFARTQAPRAGAARLPGAEVLTTSIKAIRLDAAEKQRGLAAQAARRAAGEFVDVSMGP
jgi:hypothetical protein